MSTKIKSLHDGAVLRREAPPPPASSRSRLAELPAGEPSHGGGRNPRKGAPRKLFEGAIVRRAVVDSFKKLDPRHQLKNPVMFVVEVGSLFTTVLFLQALAGKGEAPAGFILAVSAWLWFTVL
ncbi:MAG TPA: potassium-transporting ATPase subunit B, partial [Labilithrix sp.]|nr:potassium-transporting ATPase subunit B [Labilithrix sp.]